MSLLDDELPISIPSAVRDRLEAIVDVARERRALVVQLSADARAAANSRDLAQARVRELERGGARANHSALVLAREEVERETKAHTKLAAKYAERQPGAEAAMRLADALLRYVRANAASIAVHEGDVPRLRNDESPVEGYERAARRVRELEADRRAVRAAPIPSSTAKALARQQIEERIAAARPDVLRAIEYGGQIDFPTRLFRQPGTTSDTTVPDAWGVVAWLLKDAFLAAIDREIDLVAADDEALSPQQRIEQLRIIDADLLEATREEVAFAEAAGLTLRPDIDPRAALNLSALMPAPEGGAT